MKDIYRRALTRITFIVLQSRSRDPAAIKCMQIAQDALIEAGKPPTLKK
jgi:hypothetical protein